MLALLAGALSPATTAGVRAFVPHLADGPLVLTLPTITREPRVAENAAANRWLGFGALLSLRYGPALTLFSPVFFFSYGPLEAALPIYGRQTLHAHADGYGLLWTGFGAGAFAGVLTLTELSHRWRPSIALPMSCSGSSRPRYAGRSSARGIRWW